VVVLSSPGSPDFTGETDLRQNRATSSSEIACRYVEGESKELPLGFQAMALLPRTRRYRTLDTGPPRWRLARTGSPSDR